MLLPVKNWSKKHLATAMMDWNAPWIPISKICARKLEMILLAPVISKRFLAWAIAFARAAHESYLGTPDHWLSQRHIGDSYYRSSIGWLECGRSIPPVC